MEDQHSAMEGSIEEYSSEERRGKVSWILCKGLTVGKKILVTGFVVSSAPVVVPPLAVISFLGFACSVPVGLLLASYACTDKLMSMLLPGSRPPPFLLDYGEASYMDGVVEDDDYGEEEDEWRKGGGDTEKEEEEMLEDMRETVEMRIELVENDNGPYIDDAKHGRKKKDEIEIVAEIGYEEDIDEYEDENEEEPMKLEVEVRIEGVGEEQEKETAIEESSDQMPVDDVLAVVVDIEGDEKGSRTIEEEEEPAIVESSDHMPVDDVLAVVVVDIEGDEKSGRTIEEEEKPAIVESSDHMPVDDVLAAVVDIEGDEKSGGTIEEGEEPKIVESSDHMPVEDVLAAVVDIEGDEKSGGTIEDTPFEVTDIVVELCQSNEVKEDGELEEETRGLLEKLREEGMTDNGENVEETKKSMEGRIGSKPLTEVEKKEDDNAAKADVIPKETDLRKTDGGLLKPVDKMIGTNDVCRLKEEKQNPVLNKPLMLQGGGDNNVAKNVVQDIQSHKEKGNLTSSNADVREIADESGFDVFDNKNAAADSYAENEHSSSTHGSPETVDYIALPVFPGQHKCNDAPIFTQEDTGMASSKEVYSEEKIWELMEAMRRIVGYKAAPQGTCMEELKALYLFTGVEPPALLKDPSDLVEVHEKLRLLMSIIGVK